VWSDGRSYRRQEWDGCRIAAILFCHGNAIIIIIIIIIINVT